MVKLLGSPIIDPKKSITQAYAVCSLAGRYENLSSSSVPTTPIDCLKIPARMSRIPSTQKRSLYTVSFPSSSLNSLVFMTKMYSLVFSSYCTCRHIILFKKSKIVNERVKMWRGS
jgi:hypothetical protein